MSCEVCVCACLCEGYSSLDLSLRKTFYFSEIPTKQKNTSNKTKQTHETRVYNNASGSVTLYFNGYLGYLCRVSV